MDTASLQSNQYSVAPCGEPVPPPESFVRPAALSARMPIRFRSLALSVLLAACACGAAQADPAQDIERSWRAGDRAGATQRLQAAIAAEPRDARLRFLQGVLYAESGRQPEAIDIYLRLTQEYPELAEPFNNLAVLYAARGELDKARDALETALRNDPGYATARENLGDVYVRLAEQAYAQAGARGPELQRKLQLARQLLAPAPRGS
jgi:Flp pilus assembly protein TadD